ncbi:helix-turn-helix domain-containing protein [Paenibacillus shenyangensis]|uniref:helix-turn-helix domain-containing protein n=1 Tax=Paenibacillus sp. A9 TaxID=1284352 RepID=UPI00037DE569|nr:AraC family transcriptional regulator [Paenibacillus sp. A9]
MSEQVQHMIDWLEDHLLEEFSLAELGQSVGYSPYYCSFLFRHHTGISMKKYIQLRRVFLSSIRLAETQKRIIDIAVEHGYSSQEAFSRSFKDVLGVTPHAFRQHPQPIQSYIKLTIDSYGRELTMDISGKQGIEQLQRQVEELYEHEILNVLNGQMMFEKFRENQWMGQSDYVPFNEAMCVHETTEEIFGDSFCRVRAEGHGSSLEQYEQIVIQPLQPLMEKEYRCIVLWFGDDMFCQINLLTLLAYLEQKDYQGTVYVNVVQEQTYDVQQTAIQLGSFADIYCQVLLNQQMPQEQMLPVMYQGIRLYLNLQQPDNEVTAFIRSHPADSAEQLLPQLFSLFSHYGMGDTQYLELIASVRQPSL